MAEKNGSMSDKEIETLDRWRAKTVAKHLERLARFYRKQSLQKVEPADWKPFRHDAISSLKTIVEDWIR